MSEDIVTTTQVQELLEMLYSKKLGVEKIQGGKHSMAFSFSHDSEDYIARFNQSDFGFRKDSYAAEHFSDHVPIPEIYTIGQLDTCYYAISKKVAGHSVRDEYNTQIYSSLELQFETVETIAAIPVPETSSGYGEWDAETETAPFDTLAESIRVNYASDQIFDWPKLRTAAGYDPSFVEYLIENVESLLAYAQDHRRLRHGDIGGSNLFIEDNTVSGIIDWHKAMYDDHLFDAARIVLYCPNRHETSTAALKFYKNRGHADYKERIMLGVYYTMITNYGAAARGDMTESLLTSPQRIHEIESYFLA